MFLNEVGGTRFSIVGGINVREGSRKERGGKQEIGSKHCRRKRRKG